MNASHVLQWGSETGSRRWLAPAGTTFLRWDELQWGSETGSRRWVVVRDAVNPEAGASMGLRDWVSEMEGTFPSDGGASGASMGLRDWVSEMGCGA